MDKFQELELFINYLPRGHDNDIENANNNLNKKRKRNKNKNKSNKKFNQERNNETTNLSDIQKKLGKRLNLLKLIKEKEQRKKG